MNNIFDYCWTITIGIIIIFSLTYLSITIIKNNERIKIQHKNIKSRLFDLMEYTIETTNKEYLFDELELCGISKYEYDHLGEQCLERINDMCNVLNIYLSCRGDDHDKLDSISMSIFIKRLHAYYANME